MDDEQEIIHTSDQAVDSEVEESGLDATLRQQEEIKSGTRPSQHDYQEDKDSATSSGLTPITATEQAAQQLNPIQRFNAWRNRNKPMWDEMYQWRAMEDGEEKLAAREAWYQKHYGKSYEEYEATKGSGFIYGGGAPTLLGGLSNWSNGLREGLTMPGLAYGDFAVDAASTIGKIARIPGSEALDNAWDEGTRFKNPVYREMRKVLSIVLPAIHGGKAVSGGLAAMNPTTTPWIAKSLIGIGAYTAVDASIIGLSDLGEEHNTSHFLAKQFPGVFGPRGRFPLPDWFKTLDGDSPEVRKYKNMMEAGPFTIVGNGIGYAIDKGKPVLRWMLPKNRAALRYKEAAKLKATEGDVLVEILELDNLIAKNPPENELKELIARRNGLVNGIDDPGSLEQYHKRAVQTQQQQTDAAGRADLVDDPDGIDFNPDINQEIVPEGSARQTIPPANVARNMGDVAAIKTGSSTGDPAPIITESIQRKGLNLGSREGVLEVAKIANQTGRFDAIINGTRYTNKVMNNTAWEIYNSIINANNIKDVENLFLKNINISDMLSGKFKVSTISPDQVSAAIDAMKDLSDRYLGRRIMESSARAMDTLGREVSTIAEATRTLKGTLNEERVTNLILDKLTFLYDEVQLNKYINKWQSNMKGVSWFEEMPGNNVDEYLSFLSEQFRTAEKSIHERAIAFRKQIQLLAQENPLAIRPLIDGFANTNGDVDTMEKLIKYASQEISPLGLIVSPNPSSLSAFAKGVWGTVYNNMLSGLSAIRAGKAAVSQVIIKPLNAFQGHALITPLSMLKSGVSGNTNARAIQKSLYYFGSVFETNRRALRNSWDMIKKTYKDPDLLAEAMRKDLVVKESKSWEMLENMGLLWEQEGNWGKLIQYENARAWHEMSRSRWSRYGMTGLTGVDAWSNTIVGTQVSRMQAYDEIFSKYGKVDYDRLLEAEKVYYGRVFDKNGLLAKGPTKNLAGEIALNLDDGIANWLNQATTAAPILKHLITFPRTLSVKTRSALSWTPIQAIPGINKYSKTIWAQSLDDIKLALKEHNIDFDTTPGAMEIFKNLRAEYVGRMMFSAELLGGLQTWALMGHIRGNGHYDPQKRKTDRDQFGFRQHTIKFPIPGKDNDVWVSYEGVPGIEQILDIMGDIASHARDIDEPLMEDLHAKLWWTMSATFLGETPLQSIEPLVAILNNDLSGFKRFVANALRSYVPLSGAMGVLSSAITSTQKNIHDDLAGYFMNRIPLASSLLVDQVDYLTGDAVNDIENPILRVLNALSTLQISAGNEPWRVAIRDSGWDPKKTLTRDSTGTYEYNPAEQRAINKEVGKQQIYKKLYAVLQQPKWKKLLGELRAHRVDNADLEYENAKLETDLLPLYRIMDRIALDALKIAEINVLRNNPDILDAVKHQLLMRQHMKAGNIGRAREQQKRAHESIHKVNQELLLHNSTQR